MVEVKGKRQSLVGGWSIWLGHKLSGELGMTPEIEKLSTSLS